jgi:hypothetical protein
MSHDVLVWQFDRIEAVDRERARSLENAPPAETLAESICDAFEAALSSHEVLFGAEQAEGNSAHLRAVIQVRIGTQLFDWFFNGRTGYRARFRIGWQTGLAYNATLIESLRHRLRRRSDRTVRCRHLNARFEDVGEIFIPRDQVMHSLDPRWAKVWFCTVLLSHDGAQRSPQLGLEGPRITLDDGASWAAPWPVDDDAWLEIKGAFLGRHGLYQPKDPETRAKWLEATGQA